MKRSRKCNGPRGLTAWPPAGIPCGMLGVPTVRPLPKALFAALAIAAVSALAGCGPALEKDAAAEAPFALPRLPHPRVERDLKQIRDQGVLRMITRYSSDSYFIHRGGGAGFEFELLREFARRQRVSLEVVTPATGEEFVTMLNAGQGDVVAAGLTIGPIRSQYASFTRPVALARQVVVLRADESRADSLPALSGLTIHVAALSAGHRELAALREAGVLHARIVPEDPALPEEELIARVARGEIRAAVAGEHLARAILPSLPTSPGVRLGPIVADRQPMAWLVRQNSPELLAALNRFLREHFEVRESSTRRSDLYGALYRRYYGDLRQHSRLYHPGDRPDLGGRISRFDDLIRAAADSFDLDWRLVAAIVYGESRFDPDAVSPAGAVGLMQVMPVPGIPDSAALHDPRRNLMAGCRRLRQIHDAYAYVDSLDRWAFALATYHAGEGRIGDARRLALDVGKDPNRWQGAVTFGLTLLERGPDPRRARYGPYPGSLTVSYVQSVLSRYRHYMRLAPENGGEEGKEDDPAPPDEQPPAEQQTRPLARGR